MTFPKVRTQVWEDSSGALHATEEGAVRAEVLIKERRRADLVADAVRRAVRESRYHHFGEYTIDCPEYRANLVKNLVAAGLDFVGEVRF